MSTAGPPEPPGRDGGGEAAAPGAPRVAFVLEGSRSREDHAALLQVAQALAREGAATSILHHGLGRLAILRLRQELRRLRPELIIVTGAASTRDVRRVATLLGCPLVRYSWPDGPVHNIHDKHDKHDKHEQPHQHERAAKHGAAAAHPGLALVPPPARSSVSLPPRVLPTRVVVASVAQKQEIQRYFAAEKSALSAERVHVLPLLPEPPPLSRGRADAPAPASAANAAALAEHTALLWEILGERSHRSLGRGLLRGMVAKAVRLGPRPPAVALAYHQVLHEVRGFDLNLVVAAGTLERHVRALQRRGYQAVTVAQQAELVLSGGASGTGASGPTFSISFDDGYQDTLEVAAPLLLSLGVPFTVYVITDLVTGARALPWYELLAHSLLARELRPAALQVLGSEPALTPLCPAAGTVPPPTLARAFLAACKALPAPRRAALMETLEKEVGPRVQALPTTPRYLDASGVLRLRDFAAEISSHSRSHPILPQLSDEALRDELVGSRTVLCQLLGGCAGLAYPNGDSDERVAAAAQAAGYNYAVAVTPQPGPPSRYRLGRRMLSELSGLGLDGRFSEDVLWARIRGALG